jgi:hypothetical protein
LFGDGGQSAGKREWVDRPLNCFSGAIDPFPFAC